MPSGHAGSWKAKALEDRARISARQRNQANKHWPRRWVLFGPRVVPLEAYLLLQMKMARGWQQDRTGFLAMIHRLEAGIKRRNESMGKAHHYIQALKRQAGLPLTGLTTLPKWYPSANVSPTSSAHTSTDTEI